MTGRPTAASISLHLQKTNDFKIIILAPGLRTAGFTLVLDFVPFCYLHWKLHYASLVVKKICMSIKLKNPGKFLGI